MKRIFCLFQALALSCQAMAAEQTFQSQVKDFPIADMIPAMILIWPISWLWTTYLLPLIQ